MLSRGTFRNLYVYGYDVPEGYAIEKDGVMYYAFFVPQSSSSAGSSQPTTWSGEIYFRGLTPGTYHVVDYVNGKDFGTVTAPNAKLQATVNDHLLLEVTKQ
jgi:alpha-galactosidase